MGEPAVFDTIITTHVNADLDGVGSMLAAQKLHPGARILFPGSAERQLRHVFIRSVAYLFDMADIKLLDAPSIKRVILVDTRQPNRLDPAIRDLALRSDVEVIVYDHHPDSPGDLRPHRLTCRPVGASVTLLVAELKKRDIRLTPEEATLLALGLFEDTGNFTFDTTTAEDFEAAAWLRALGGSVTTVSDVLHQEATPEDVRILNDMIDSMEHHPVHGIDIAIASISRERYAPDLAGLTSRLMRMEHLNALFAVARMDNKIHVIGRSRRPEVNVGKVLRALGGGGHPSAGSAALSKCTLPQAEHRLVDALKHHVQPRFHVRDVMTTPAISVTPDTPFKDASRTMTRYNVNALIVSSREGGRGHLLGIIGRQTVEQGITHHMDEVRVKDYMSTDVATAHPDESLPDILGKMTASGQRILPVMEEGQLIGVVTRTDILNLVFEEQKPESRPKGDSGRSARRKNILPKMTERLPEEILVLLEAIGAAGDRLGVETYVVGGFVRDLLLGRENDDIDIVVEGDGIAFAEAFSTGVPDARFHPHEKFGTAVITLSDGFKIDVVTARTEYYSAPAALPEVERSSLQMDLYRRDFTINTLAIQLNQKKFGTLVDHFSGQKDIRDKTIRIIHNLSFVEDPTRIFRAVRFETRFGFSIGKLTGKLIENAIRMEFFHKLSGPRVFTELKYILEEADPVPALKRLGHFKLLYSIHPELRVTEKSVALLTEVRKVLDWYDLLYTDEPADRWMVCFHALLSSCSREGASEICHILRLPKWQQEQFVKTRIRAEWMLKKLSRELPLDNSILYQHLRVFKADVLLYMMAAAEREDARKAISRYYTELRNVNIELKGRDLVALGCTPGPDFRRILQQVLDARLNGLLASKEDELAFVRNLLNRKSA